MPKSQFGMSRLIWLMAKIWVYWPKANEEERFLIQRELEAIEKSIGRIR